jgi:hypothetical protein
MRRTRMKKLALLLSLLALGALGLVACGGDDDEGTTPEAKPFRTQVQELERAANDWASRFATDYCTPNMGEGHCNRLESVSAAFQTSFADATAEDIEFKGVEGRPNSPLYRAAVKFSNGEVVVFIGGGPEPPACAGAPPVCDWYLAENRRFLQAGAPRE